LQEMIQAYYGARGWDSDGNIPQEAIHRAGLTDMVTDKFSFSGEV
jgi:aldehyde:ferredoxin oxidoreductase